MSGSLQDVSFSLKQQLSTFVSVGSYQLTGEYISVNGTGKDNYNITFIPGTITINKVQVTLSHPAIEA